MDLNYDPSMEESGLEFYNYSKIGKVIYAMHSIQTKKYKDIQGIPRFSGKPEWISRFVVLVLEPMVLNRKVPTNVIIW
jgi:hypothetical protein